MHALYSLLFTPHKAFVPSTGTIMARVHPMRVFLFCWPFSFSDMRVLYSLLFTPHKAFVPCTCSISARVHPMSVTFFFAFVFIPLTPALHLALQPAV
jgi:hypothetical protein